MRKFKIVGVSFIFFTLNQTSKLCCVIKIFLARLLYYVAQHLLTKCFSIGQIGLTFSRDKSAILNVI